MKIITAYVNTVRIHWLVEELFRAGISEAKVTEYFSPLSRISRLQVLCPGDRVGRVRDLVHTHGTTGESGDHLLHISDFVEPELTDLRRAKVLSVLDLVPPPVEAIATQRTPEVRR